MINFFQLNEEFVNIVFNMFLKFYAMKNQSFKNPLNSVLTELVKTIFGFLNATFRTSIMKKKNKVLEEKKMRKRENKNLKKSKVIILKQKKKIYQGIYFLKTLKKMKIIMK